MTSVASVRRAAHRAALAVEQRDQAIRNAHAAGATLRAIAAAAELSHQRVHQIVRKGSGSSAAQVEP